MISRSFEIVLDPNDFTVFTWPFLFIPIFRLLCLFCLYLSETLVGHMTPGVEYHAMDSDTEDAFYTEPPRVAWWHLAGHPNNPGAPVQTEVAGPAWCIAWASPTEWSCLR